MEITVRPQEASAVALFIVVKVLYSRGVKVKISKGEFFSVDENKLNSSREILLSLSKIPNKFFGSIPSEKNAIKAFFQQRLLDDNQPAFQKQLLNMEKTLSKNKYLVGSDLTAADVYRWTQLFESKEWRDQLNRFEGKFVAVEKWYLYLQDEEAFIHGVNCHPHLRRVNLLFFKIPAIADNRLKVGIALVETSNEIDEKITRMCESIINCKHELWLVVVSGGKKELKPELAISQKIGSEYIDRIKCVHVNENIEVLMEKCSVLIQRGHAYVEKTESIQKKRKLVKNIEGRVNSIEENEMRWLRLQNEGQHFYYHVRAKCDKLKDPILFSSVQTPINTGGKLYWIQPTVSFSVPILHHLADVTHRLFISEVDQSFDRWLRNKLDLDWVVYHHVKDHWEKRCRKFSNPTKPNLALTGNQGKLPSIPDSNQPKPGYAKTILRENSVIVRSKQIRCTNCASLEQRLKEAEKMIEVLKTAPCPKCQLNEKEIGISKENCSLVMMDRDKNARNN